MTVTLKELTNIALPTYVELLEKYSSKEAARYDIEVAYYRGAMSVLRQLHRELGDEPSVAEFIETMADIVNSDIAG